MRMAVLMGVISNALLMVAVVGLPFYVNFYSSESSKAFLSIAWVITCVAYFMPLFLVTQLIVSVTFHFTKKGKCGTIIGLLKQLINIVGFCFYVTAIGCCVFWNVADFLEFGFDAYENFPMSLGLSIYVGLSLEVSRLVLQILLKVVVPDCAQHDNKCVFNTGVWKPLKSISLKGSGHSV